MAAHRIASGKDAWGICDQSGLRCRLADMRTQWNGLKVHPDWYEEKHPQLEPRRDITDAQALDGPRPDSRESTTYIQPLSELFPDTSGGGSS